MDKWIKGRNRKNWEYNLYSMEALKQEEQKKKQLKISMEKTMFQIPMLINFFQSASDLWSKTILFYLGYKQNQVL